MTTATKTTKTTKTSKTTKGSKAAPKTTKPTDLVEQIAAMDEADLPEIDEGTEQAPVTEQQPTEEQAPVKRRKASLPITITVDGETVAKVRDTSMMMAVVRWWDNVGGHSITMKRKRNVVEYTPGMGVGSIVEALFPPKASKVAKVRAPRFRGKAILMTAAYEAVLGFSVKRFAEDRIFCFDLLAIEPTGTTRMGQINVLGHDWKAVAKAAKVNGRAAVNPTDQPSVKAIALQLTHVWMPAEFATGQPVISTPSK